MPARNDAPVEEVVPAATVVLLRETSDDLEVLLLHRNEALAAFAGAWVFPGGRIDPADYRDGVDEAAAARRAAAREVQEEAGLIVDAAKLTSMSRWTTPVGWGRRYRSWFFVSRAPTETVRIDNGEIDGHRWITPRRALDAHRVNEIVLPPATFVTLLGLSTHTRIAPLLASLEGTPPREYLPRTMETPSGRCSLYQGDVAYETGDLSAAGPRHRLLMTTDGWRYEDFAGGLAG